MESSVSQSFFGGAEIFIPKVGINIRVGREDYCNPKLVSIGPYHHGNSQLRAMEGHKEKCLKDLLDRNNTPYEKCIEEVRGKETQARKCYQAIMAVSVCQFVKMMVLDAGFIIELFMKQSEESHPSGFSSFYPLLKRDMLLLENQLPFFILQCIFDLTINQRGPGLKEIAIKFLNSQGERTSVPLQAGNLHHLFLHLYQYQFATDNSRFKADPIPSIPSATKLHVMGVKFEKASQCSLLTDVELKDAVIKVPRLVIAEDTFALFFNLITFEQYNVYNITLGTHITSYVVFMSYMLSAAEDVKFLCSKDIIEHRLANHEEVVHLLRRMCSGVFIHAHFSSLLPVLRCIKKFSERPDATRRKTAWEERMAEKPWYYLFYRRKVTIAITLLGGVGLWVFSGVQAVYTVFGCFQTMVSLMLAILKLEKPNDNIFSRWICTMDSLRSAFLPHLEHVPADPAANINDPTDLVL